MKALKIIGIILLLLIIAFLVGAALIPKNFHVEATATIDRPAAVVFKQVNNFKNWSEWSPWEQADPEMVSTYEGPVLGVGAAHVWTSETQGSGSQTITESVPYEVIKTNLDFMEQGKATSYFTFNEENSTTTVEWGMDTETSYPFERVLFFFLKGMMEGMFEEGLANLKEVTESMPDPVDIEMTTIPEMIAITVTDSSSWDDIEMKMGEMYGLLMQTMQRRGLAMTGMPFTMYHEWDEAKRTATYEAGIPVDKKIKPSGRIECKLLAPKKALKGVHFGAYDQTGYLYLALDEYLMERGLEMEGGPIEFYINDPSNEPDTSKWQTEIYFPYK